MNAPGKSPSSSWSVWVAAARPRTLWAALAPVLLGTALAIGDGGFHAPAALMAALAAALFQIGSNFCNDYADFRKGADTAARQGPLRVTQAGLVTPRQMRIATAATFALALAASGYLVWRGGWTIAALAVLCVAAGVLYTAGPVPYGYVGLGEVFVLIFFGPVAVAGTHYVQALRWAPEAIAAGLGPGLLSVAILVVNNLRDVDTDRQAGKRTLAVRFGRGFARAEYVICLAGAAATAAALAVTKGRPGAWLAVAALAVAAVPPLRRVWRGTTGAELNPALGQTARGVLFYCLAFSIGWLL